MTLNTTATGKKHDEEEAPNFSFIIDPDNSSKSGPELDAKLQVISGSLHTNKLYK